MTDCDDLTAAPPAKRGVYIVFEGVDGAGKSTLVKNVVSDPRLKGPVCTWRFPTENSPTGALIRRVFRGEEHVDIHAMLHLLVADAINAQPELERILSSGMAVFCDRHTCVSGWVYQTDHHSLDYVLAVQQRAYLLAADLVFVLDLPAEVARDRVFKIRGSDNPLYEHDDLERFRRLRNRYATYVGLHPNCVVLDAQQSPEALTDQVFEVLQKCATT